MLRLCACLANFVHDVKHGKDNDDSRIGGGLGGIRTTSPTCRYDRRVPSATVTSLHHDKTTESSTRSTDTHTVRGGGVRIKKYMSSSKRYSRAPTAGIAKTTSCGCNPDKTPAHEGRSCTCNCRCLEDSTDPRAAPAGEGGMSVLPGGRGCGCLHGASHSKGTGWPVARRQ